MVIKHVDNLMFCIEELFIKLQSIKYATTFKDKHGSKESTSTSCVSTKLHMNFNRSFNKAVMKHFCKIPFEDFVNDGNLKFFMHIFSCTLKYFFQSCRADFSRSREKCYVDENFKMGIPFRAP